MNIKKLNEQLNKIINENNEDVEELHNIIPTLEGYKEHLYMWLDDEPENAKEEGADEIIHAIDIVINGISKVENV
jgi:hypothetical protein